MRVAICADMEGLAGIDRVEHCFPSFGSAYRHGVRMLVADVRAAIDGAAAAGATDVLVADWHYLGQNLPEGALPEVPIRRLWRRGRPAIDGKGLGRPDAAVLVGVHAAAGNPEGFLSHTFWMGMSVQLDGVPVSESVLWALALGATGIPVVTVAGDQRAIQEIAGLVRGAQTVAMKAGTGRTTALLRSPQDAREELREVVRESLPSTVDPVAWRFPVEATIRYASSDHAAAAERAGIGERTGDRDVTSSLGSAHDLLPYVARAMMATPLGRAPALANRLVPTSRSGAARAVSRTMVALGGRLERRRVRAWGQEPSDLYPRVGSSSSGG